MLSHFIPPVSYTHLDVYKRQDMARDILEYTDYEEIRTMAQNIIDVQEKEIAQMEKILNDQQESQPE